MNERNKGITLIVLIITIIVLLILTGVSLSLILGEDGMIGKSEYTVKKTNENTILEELQLKILDVQSEKLR